MQRVRRELASLYFAARDGERDVQDVARLAYVLALAARMIEGAELEARLAVLEAKQGGDDT